MADGTYYAPPSAPQVATPARLWVHVGLLLLTVASTTLVGAEYYRLFSGDFGGTPPDPSSLRDPVFWLHGLWYSLAVLGILGCHEMGHYVACRYYRVDASLPYFLPFPLAMTGTLGAFIKIRSRIPSKTALFDIGIAGPIAGFVVAIPLLVAGLALSRVVPLPADVSGMAELGEPLIFKLAAYVIFDEIPRGSSINLHPMAFAAWFGLLATMLNLFPISQLDGGHISYAVFGNRSTWISLAMLAILIGLTMFSLSWAVWTFLLVVMMFVVGARHPPTLNDHERLDGRRLLLAAFALLILLLCFMPAPIEVLGIG